MRIHYIREVGSVTACSPRLYVVVLDLGFIQDFLLEEECVPIPITFFVVVVVVYGRESSKGNPLLV